MPEARINMALERWDDRYIVRTWEWRKKQLYYGSGKTPRAAILDLLVVLTDEHEYLSKAPNRKLGPHFIKTKELLEKMFGKAKKHAKKAAKSGS